MRLAKKGDIACVIDYPRNGVITETTVISSGSKCIKVKDYPYICFNSETLYNDNGHGKLFIGSKNKYVLQKKENAKRKELIDKISSKLRLLSTIQLMDIEYQINQLL